MPRYDFRRPRLYVEAALEPGATVALDRAQTHRLGTVLRLKSGDRILVFNGSEGEWEAMLTLQRRTAVVLVGGQKRAQSAAHDLHYLFAPIKAARLDYMVQKAVEMGVSLLQPVLTRHGQIARVNTGRMRANAIEAAEQCGILSLPRIEPPLALARLLAGWDPERWLVFCDEDATVANPTAALKRVQEKWEPVFRPDARQYESLERDDDSKISHPAPAGLPGSPLAVLIGPEGGFAEDERAALLKLPRVVRLSLGPRILRADTAAVAALALVQAVLGDWR